MGLYGIILKFSWKFKIFFNLISKKNKYTFSKSFRGRIEEIKHYFLT